MVPLEKKSEKAMAHWTDQQTNAYQSLDDTLAIVDKILSFAKDGVGKPSASERALFAAAVTFTYGVWENYVEQLAIELAEKIANEILPQRVPEQIRKILEKRTAWELTVTPGWRALWAESVRTQAVGDDEEKFGMNTAKYNQVKVLLMAAGVKDPYKGAGTDIVPAHLPKEKKSVDEAVNALVELRGEIVHTGKVPNSLRKGHVLEWRNFIYGIAEVIDSACRAQCRQLVI